MKLQIDIPEDYNQELKIIKEINGFNTLQETLLEILRKVFEHNMDYHINWLQQIDIQPIHRCLTKEDMEKIKKIRKISNDPNLKIIKNEK